MSDDELLAAVIERVFESRDEAEHVVQCSMCEVSGEDGPYRCRDNPVEIELQAEQQRQSEAARVVWALIDFALGISEMRALEVAAARAVRLSMERMMAVYRDELEFQAGAFTMWERMSTHE